MKSTDREKAMLITAVTTVWITSLLMGWSLKLIYPYIIVSISILITGMIGTSFFAFVFWGIREPLKGNGE